MSPQPTAPARSKRLLRTGAAFAVLVGLAVYLVVQYVTGGPGAPRCSVRTADGGAPYEISPEQAANAATISAVGSSRGLPERAVTIALATAMQESGLRNIGFGDRDSVGLFQQRPSQDWGTVQQIMDPVYSAGEFYTHLAKVPGYSRLPLTVAAQKVQRSGYPQAYAKHEPDAALLTGALTGRDGAAMTCSVNRPADRKHPGGTDGVRKQLVREFGADVLPHTDGTAPDKDGGKDGGRVLTVPARPVSSGDAGDEAAAGGRAPGAGQAGGTSADGDGSGSQRRGWELATWAMAQSGALGIEQISYAGKMWSAADSGKGWQKATGAAARAPGADVRIVTAK
ncbi:heavy metal transporter [Streptomyces sp. CB02923]|uniref:heavy metal transporter n=1 Tax=Streptomyces sp. CB02923 TaxID=1718985 RepID=UPI0009389E25|nr:heavy metal transporter [Streptomyces sp. CB02923]OKI09662.1 heavy metal transporter [Streptomyces sp. CB02923]